MPDFGSIKSEDLKFFVNSGLGFLILAGILVVAWLKRKNGKGTAVAATVPAPAGNGLTVTYHQLVAIAEDLRVLSERVADYHKEARLYYQAGERAAEERHGEAGKWQVQVVTSIAEWRKAHEKDAA